MPVVINMNFPQRKPTRISNYDYSKNGYYFVTICTHNRKCILSEIDVGEGFPLPNLTPSGKVAEKMILSVNEKYPCVKTDKFVIMPNHIHIIFLIDNDAEINGREDPSPTISNVVGWLKYNITKQINQINGIVYNKIFQRSFHDHIIRSEKDYFKIWEYIDNNPTRWKTDCFYIEN